MNTLKSGEKISQDRSLGRDYLWALVMVFVAFTSAIIIKALVYHGSTNVPDVTLFGALITLSLLWLVFQVVIEIKGELRSLREKIDKIEPPPR